MSTRPEPPPDLPLARLAWLGMAGLALALLFLAPAAGQTPGGAAAGPSPVAQPAIAQPAVTQPLAGSTPAADAPAAEASAPEPDGYRMEAYRAPTPATLKGARVVDTPAAEKLWRDKAALFVDVMPRDVKPANLPAGTIWRDKKREHLPGSVWLPNVGYGALSPEMDAYFRRGLAAITGERKDTPLVFYCLTDCWMSWNAARRAMAYGYGAVAWYPGGSDGWAKAGLPLELATPYD